MHEFSAISGATVAQAANRSQISQVVPRTGRAVFAVIYRKLSATRHHFAAGIFDFRQHEAQNRE
jgi:hypothetical protein